MRFNVLVALVVATFVSSCSSFVTAETTALDGYTYDGKEVVRRLREDSEVQEERGPREKWREVVALLPRSPIAEVDTQSIAKNALLHQQSGDVTNVNLIEHEVLQNPNSLSKSATDLEHEVPQNPNSPHKLATNPRSSKVTNPDKAKNVDVYERLGKGAEEKLKNAKLDAALLKQGDPKEVEKLVELFVKGAKKEKPFWLKVLRWVAASVGVVSFVTLMYLLIRGGPKGSPPTTVIGTTTPGGA